MVAKLTKNYINKKLEENCEDGHLVQMAEDEEYKNSRTKNLYICECGWEFENTWGSIRGELKRNGKFRCPTNRAKKFWNYKMLKNKFEKEGCKLLTPESELEKGHGIKHQQEIKYICNCGDEDTKTINGFLTGARCMKCGSRKAGDKFKHDYEFVKQYIAEQGYELLTPENEYFNGRQTLDAICDRGHECEIRFIPFYNSGRRCKYCANEDNRGAGNPSWNPDLTYEDRIKMRRHPDYREWRNSVFERDDYTCQITGIKGCRLTAHHLYSFDEYEELRLDVDNGITINKQIHKTFHNHYGYGENTKEQFEEFEERYYNGEFDDELSDKYIAS